MSESLIKKKTPINRSNYYLLGETEASLPQKYLSLKTMLKITITVEHADDETPLHAEVESFDEARMNLGAMEQFVARKSNGAFSEEEFTNVTF